MVRTSPTGGQPKRLTTLDTLRGEVAHFRPRFLQGDKLLSFSVAFKGDTSHTEVVSLGTRARRVLPVPPGWTMAGMVDRQLVIERKGSLPRCRSMWRWRTMGEPVTVLDSVLSPSGVSVTDRGSLAYVRGRSGNRLAIVDEHGGDAGGSNEEVPIISHPRFSPDGRRIALEAVFGSSFGAARTCGCTTSRHVYSRD